MDAKEFHRRLDALYASEDTRGAHAFLREQLAAAETRGETTMLLTVANAYLGFCRENVLFDQIEGLYRTALRCIEELDLHGTMEEAVTLLNSATAFCVMGKEELSEELYRRSTALHETLLEPGDPRLAAVYNNHGLLYRAQGKTAQAREAFRRAFGILGAGNGAADELASSRLNIASVTEDLEEAEKLITDALAYYVTPEGSVDIHRFTALAALAELCFRRGDYREAGRRFEETARAWREMGLAEQRRGILLRNALYSYESAGARDDAERVRTLLGEAGG